MLNATIQNYGGPFVNAKPIEDPTSQPDALLYNRQSEDVAQMTKTCRKMLLHFPAVATGNSTPSYCETLWGSGASFFPTTVTRTGAGLYTVTFPATFTDSIGVVETISFAGAVGSVQSATVLGLVFCSAASNVITLVTTLAAAPGTAADLTAGTLIRLEAR